MARPANTYRGARRNHARKFGTFYRLPGNAFQPTPMRGRKKSDWTIVEEKSDITKEIMNFLKENKDGKQT